MSTPNVIIFGETGGGKSSLVNLIAGHNIAPVSSRSEGCTTDYKVDIEATPFNLHDTAGLEEALGGTVVKYNAISQLYQLQKARNRRQSPRLLYARSENQRVVCQELATRLRNHMPEARSYNTRRYMAGERKEWDGRLVDAK